MIRILHILIIRRFILAMVLLSFTSTAAIGQSLSFTGPNRSTLLQNQPYIFTWTSSGIRRVNIIVYGNKTPLGTISRGNFRFVAAKSVLASRGKVSWKVPWVDSIHMIVKLKGYNADRKVVAVAQRSYGYRPAILANRHADGLYLDLHRRWSQRLYVQRDGVIIRAYLSSSSVNYLWGPPNVHPKIPHDHAGVFHIQSKEPDHWSKLFDVRMFWAMRYNGGHFVHATSPNLYWNLGRPASHGCNRLTRYDAQQLFIMTPIGTRIEVIGPKG